MDIESPGGASYFPTSPRSKPSISFKGRLPRVFVLGGIPLLIFLAVNQYALLKYYTEPALPHILKVARSRVLSTPTLDRRAGSHPGGLDDFGYIAAQIQNGPLRNVRKTLKEVEESNKSDRKKAAKEMFENIMAELQEEVKSIDLTEVSKQSDKHKYSSKWKQNKETWTWGPQMKEPSEFPISIHLSSKDASNIKDVLEWEYNVKEKDIPYTGNEKYMAMFPMDLTAMTIDRRVTNSMVVAPYVDDYHLHGLVGINPENGRQWYNPEPMPEVCSVISEDECSKRLKAGGGFDLTMSNAKPLDTIPPINKLPDDCMAYVTNINIMTLPDASVAITFFNEPLSTLLRTVHSVLNNTPPPLLREIILVDDRSDLPELQAGGALDLAIRYLPKVKILRQPERRGLVMGRIAGIQNSLGTVAIILDSHVEVNQYWLEPMLQRIIEEPKAVVFPIVAGIDQTTFEPVITSGIGTWLSWTWQIVESSTFEFPPKSIKPVPSPSMAGGLFAVRRDTFFDFGGYDEQMAMWGAENVEMPFRVWQCGGRVEGIPCSITYHIYRKGGHGYNSPTEAVMMNRLRTARLWMDEWYQVARFFILFGKDDKEKEERIIGNMDEMLTLKNDLKCKNFDWFLENIDPNHSARKLSDIQIMGHIRSMSDPEQCLDIHGKSEPNDMVGTYKCHVDGASQAWFAADGPTAASNNLISIMNPRKCINRIHPVDAESNEIENFGMAGIVACNTHSEADWNLHHIEFADFPPGLKTSEAPKDIAEQSVPGRLFQTDKNHPEYGKRCLTKINDSKNTVGNLAYETCVDDNLAQWWWIQKPTLSKETFVTPTVSPEHAAYLKPFMD